MESQHRKVRLGIVGCGVIAGLHLKMAANHPWIEVVAVADIREEAARGLAEKFNIGTYYTDAEALIADPAVEGVLFALPPNIRAALALKALQAGKHVLLEKPTAMNESEIRELLAAQGDLVAACCSARLRFFEHARIAEETIAAGTLGELRVVRGHALFAANKAPEKMPPVWRLNRAINAGGILTNWGCYDIDYLLGVTGWSLVPETVLAQTWQIPPVIASHVPSPAQGTDAETHAMAFIRCVNGAVIQLDRGEYMPARTAFDWQIIGTLGSLALEAEPDGSKRLTLDRLDPQLGVLSETLWHGVEDHNISHAGPIVDFATAIATGGQPKTSLRQSLQAQRITDAIYASADSGLPMTL
ncbi:Gfo/Idh/MocA family protein [Paenibacillus cymbidii]|uniref:Gfo/Idh/MocA family protein n=1 Tax=Paenibacillus cymbidii TaxID=1639034 RepID=UPI0014368F53|nr:Gfo/Idh/MocA family oxidoreductase [Paenibacillus cymbidii]